MRFAHIFDSVFANFDLCKKLRCKNAVKYAVLMRPLFITLPDGYR